MKLPFRSRRAGAPATPAASEPVAAKGAPEGVNPDLKPGTTGGPTHQGGRLQVGAGRERFPGWVNLDIQELPGVDVVANVNDGLNFSGMEAIYAEHFLEHLRIDDALNFLSECHRVLADGGWLRLSTPNLEWVMMTHYDIHAPARERELRAIITNRAFHGWRHQFLWNRPLLGRALAACGFPDVQWHRYGESDHPERAGLERHDKSEDSEEFPHVLIAEAEKGAANPEALAELWRELEEHFLSQLVD